MDGPILQLVIAAAVAGVIGAALAYRVAMLMDKRRIKTLGKQHATELADAAAEKRKLIELGKKMQDKIGSLESKAANYRSELEAVLSEKSTESDRHQKEIKDIGAQHERAIESASAEATKLNAESEILQARIDELQETADSYRAELAESAREKQAMAREKQAAVDQKRALAAENKTLNDNVKKVTDKSRELVNAVNALHEERELTKGKVNEMQNMLTAVHQRTLALQKEFVKAGEFYKGELAKSFKVRQRLEEELKMARAEQDAFNKRIAETVKDQGHGSAEDLILNAEAQLGQISTLERNLKKIRSERADLQEEIKNLRKANEKLATENGEIVELKIHNEQLIKAVEALEQSRAAHETEAESARNKAQQSEQMSDTLRMKLSDLQKGFAEMEKEQTEAINDVRKAAAAARPSANQQVEYHEIYDLVPSTMAS